MLGKVIARLMERANIPGYYTNHSLRSSATTRLFNAHVDEQLIMTRMGHSSTGGVRVYKRMSDQLQQETSAVLNKKVCTDIEQIEEAPPSTCTESPSSASSSVASSILQTSLPNLGFNISATNVNFNFNIPSN